MAFRPKLWLTLGAALTLTAACSEQGQPGGETGGESGGEGGAAAQGADRPCLSLGAVGPGAKTEHRRARHMSQAI